MNKVSCALAIAATLASQGAMAQTFNNGLPSGWAVSGNAGTDGVDGVVTLAPTQGSTAYGWVSTANSTAQAGYNLGNETNGSTLTSTPFTSKAGDSLTFYFNYVTSDGGGYYSDYAYANLLDANTGATVAVLFDARTEAAGTIAPGMGLPTPQATLVPPSVPIIPGGPEWSPLGPDSSGACFDDGCGYTGWVQSTYGLTSAGTYELQFGVTNWGDEDNDSGLAFDGITVGGMPISPVPEPTNIALLLAGLGAVGVALRRRDTSR